MLANIEQPDILLRPEKIRMCAKELAGLASEDKARSSDKFGMTGLGAGVIQMIRTAITPLAGHSADSSAGSP